MNLISAIATTPIPHDLERGVELAHAFDATGQFAELLKGVGGCSPYLYSILIKEKDWILTAVQLDDPLSDLMPNDMSNATAGLRCAKRRLAGYAALADAAGYWDLSDVTAALTNFADRAVQVALDAARAPFVQRGKLPRDDGQFVLAMGKMGAHELNYSSDIDLIVLFEDQGLSLEEIFERRQILAKCTRTAMETLSKITEDGYVFRTDLRLRPDPSVTPVCIGTSAALSYYESLGRTWERAAFIKARVCAGDREVGQTFLNQMRPFIWRKHLDFAAIDEAHDLRLRIRNEKGLYGPITLPGHNMKLGRGGIREIEFFAQFHQLISGGRDATLQKIGTIAALNALVVAGKIDASTRDALADAYTWHRMVEHRLQMTRDNQTHSLPHSDEGLERIAAFCGKTLPAFLDITHTHLARVHEITEGFFAPDPITNDAVHHDFGTEITAQWPAYPALRSDRAHGLFDRMRPQILRRLEEAPDTQEALRHFDRFLAGLPTGVQIFSLFAANPEILDLLLDIATKSPALAEYLGQNTRVFDAVLDGAFFGEWPGEEGLEKRLNAQLAGSKDYEDGLETARVWQNEWHFAIGVHLVRGIISPPEASKRYRDLAVATLRALLPFVLKDFERKFGAIDHSEIAILAMGSLGNGFMNTNSDLDLLFIFDCDLDKSSTGPRSIPARTYFPRLTQAFITALTALMSKGRLYEVDMRLRPSGRKGPVATSFASFESYQTNEAWTWEHLALTSARAIAGDVDLCGRLSQSIRKVLNGPFDKAKVKTDLSDMRAKLAQEKPAKSDLDVKNGPGGLQDIELFRQAQILLNAGSNEHQHLSDKTNEEIQSAYDFQTDLNILMSLLCRQGEKKYPLGTGGSVFVKETLGVQSDAALQKTLAELRQVAANLISRALE